MLKTGTITEFDPGLPATLAFRIDGKVTAEDMTQLSERALEAFEQHDRMDMLLVIDRFEGSELGAALNIPSIKAQAASLNTLRTYAVAGAPETAGRLIEGMGRLMPVDAQTFDSESAALDHLRAQPRLA
jgi:hypothetical protein